MDININELKKICIDFFRLAETGFSLWDENRNNIFSYPEKHGPFCKAVRENKNLYMKCAVSDKIGLDEVDRTKKPYIYTCHMGLTEAVVPILQDGETAGYIMMGQIAEKERVSEIVKAIEKLNDSSVFKEKLCNALEQNTVYTHDKILYCVNTLKVLIDYMSLSYVFEKNNQTVFAAAKKYISNNMSSPLQPKDLSKHIGVSQSTLYKEIKSNAGCSPTEYIRRKKIEKAMGLLKNTSAGISEIAESVGFSDSNYFIRVFRSQTGLSPLKYRKQFIQ